MAVKQIVPSCTCLLIECAPTKVPAHGEATVCVSIVPDTRGWMSRSVMVTLDNKQTLEFNIDLHVV